MRAIILAGGKGSRLSQYTSALPKPLVPVGGVPIAEIIVRQLERAGIKHITMAVGYLSNLLEDHFKDGKKYGLTIDYSHEAHPLGTSGPLALIGDLDRTFLVINGDVLTTLDYTELVAYHHQRGALLTIAMHERNIQIDLGVIETDSNNVLTGFVEKPVYHYRASMGVYVFEPRVLNYIRPGSYLDFNELITKLIAAQETVLAYPFNGHWLDIGSLDDYARAGEIFADVRDQFLPDETMETR